MNLNRQPTANDAPDGRSRSAAVARQRVALRRARAGLTLWEVMLALAILGGSIAVIGQLVRLGVRSAGEARDLATAQLLCEAKMAELASGIEPPQVVTAAPMMFETDWLYSVELQQVDQAGLLAVRVTVQKIAYNQMVPVTFSLDRWIIDPSLEFQQAEAEAMEDAEAAAAAEAEAAASSSSPTTGTSAGAAGGASGGSGQGGR
jgi:general secretion pathway protein I